MKIAVCDDDKKDIARLKKLIKAYDADNNIGFSVSEYESGSELLKDVSNGEDVDIIFLDINMDDMDGLSVAKKIREKMDDVPIVLNTDTGLDRHERSITEILLTVLPEDI